MNDRINVWVLFEDSVKGLLVGDIDLGKLGSLAADELDAVQDLIGGVVQVVSNDDLVVGLEKRKGGERADVAGSSTSVSFMLMAWGRHWAHTQ